MIKVATIIINYNSLPQTKECLASLEKSHQGKFSLKIIVVDNASEDFSEKALKAEFPNVTIISLPENTGFTGGNNIGIEKALEIDCKYLFLLNNDTLIDPQCISTLIEGMESDKSIGIMGPKIYFEKGYEYHRDRYTEAQRGKVIWYAGGIIDWQDVLFTHKGLDEVDHGQYNKIEETQFVSGCAMIIRGDIIRKIGNFDNRYFLYLEDVDLCLRAQKAGNRLVYNPRAVVWHKNASSSNKPGSPIHQYYQTRNRLLFGMKYAATRAKLALLRESLKFTLKGGIKRKAVLDFYLQNWGRGL